MRSYLFVKRWRIVKEMLMKELNGRVAVVTGAASGIGLALSERLGREGMRVVLADIDEEQLANAEKKVRQTALQR
jgi:NAD(P)-dependent dehydrogenase (short-subunit alcohol dehydrogenase family)